MGNYLRLLGVIGSLFVLSTWSAGQQISPLDWRKVDPSHYMPGQLQVRFTPAFYTQIASGDIAFSGNNGFGIPVLDSIWYQLGFISYHRLVPASSQHAKLGRTPANTKVLRWVRIKLKSDDKLIEAMSALELCTEWVEKVEPVYPIILHDEERPFEATWIPNDTLFNAQWHYNNTGQTGGTVDADIDLTEAWDLEKGHPSVVVAIMDNGLDTTHPDLKPNLWERRGYNFFTNQQGLVPGNHGNHVGGTVGAASNNTSFVAGVAGGNGTPQSGARLMSCQIFGPSSGANGVENAFIYSADNGAAISHNSWGFSQPDIFNQSVLDAIDYFIEYGGGTVLEKGLVIFSGGNRNEYVKFWPAVYHKVIGVTATNHNDRKAWYSTYHETLDIAAPGGEVNSTSGGSLVNGGRNGILSTVTMANGAFAYQQGTSMAAPLVSGVAALAISKALGRLSADDVKSILLLTTDVIPAMSEPSFAGRMGTGRLNAFSAVQQAAAIASAPEVQPPSGFIGEAICADIRLEWQKNNLQQDVMIAVSTNFNRGGLFGLPRGAYQVGDNIAGGGRVVYKGPADQFIFANAFPENTYFFKIWSVSAANQYSMGIVLPNFIATENTVINAGVTANCFDKASIEWFPNTDCSVPQILLAFSATNNFVMPMPTTNVGDALGPNATVLYKGNATQFEHNLTSIPDGSFLHYRVWPILPNGTFGPVVEASGQTPLAITGAAIGATTNSTLEVNWSRNSCFTGDVIVAFANQAQFGNPGFTQTLGNTINGGGTIIYKGSASTFLHSGLQLNTRYHYAIWPLVNGVVGKPQFISGSTNCTNDAIALPFKDEIDLSSLSNCGFDTAGIRNFTAGPLPRVSIVQLGSNPTVVPFQGNYMLQFNSFDTRESNEVALTSPRLSSVGVQSVDVRYKWYEDGSDYNSPFFEEERVSLFWSTDKLNWQPIVQYTRIPEYGSDGWKLKQVTLPAAAANQPNLYVQWVFRSAWGFNCYLDEIEVAATKHKLPNDTPSTAVAQFMLSDGYTHFYDSTGHLLLSINDDGTFLGHVEESLKITLSGPPVPVLLTNNNNYVRNTGGWLASGNYYTTSGWLPRNQEVFLRQYIAPNEYAKFQAAGSVLLSPALQQVDSNAVFAYHLPTASQAQGNPQSGHVGFGVATQYGTNGFWQFNKGVVRDTLQYQTIARPGLWKIVETRIMQPGSGGIGIGSSAGNGALAARFLSISVRRENNQTLLNWTTGYERGFTFFGIERRQSTDTNFIALPATVAARGLPQTGSDYTYTDTETFLPNGTYFYKVKAFDRLGNEYVSAAAPVEVINVKGVVVFPNPIRSGEMMIYSEQPMQNARIIDAIGRVVMRIGNTNTSQRVQVGNLASGIYYLQASMEGQLYTRRILIAR